MPFVESQFCQGVVLAFPVSGLIYPILEKIGHFGISDNILPVKRIKQPVNGKFQDKKAQKQTKKNCGSHVISPVPPHWVKTMDLQQKPANSINPRKREKTF
jgi:hypothetical protein